MEIMVEFILVKEDFPIDEVYKKIGIFEGIKESLGKKIFATTSSKNYIREKECSITYSTGYFETINVEIPIKKICTMLFPVKKQIIECIKEYELQSKFCIVINLTSNPIINLSCEFINLAAELGADIEFDTYLDNDKVK